MNTTTLRQWCQLNQNDAWLGVYWSTNDYGDIKRDSTCVDIFWSLLCLHLNMSLICLYDHGLGLSFSFVKGALSPFWPWRNYLSINYLFTKWGKWQSLSHKKLLSVITSHVTTQWGNFTDG